MAELRRGAGALRGLAGRTIPDEMRAVVLAGRGRAALAVRRLPVPEPGPGELLCRVDAAGICTSVNKLIDQGPDHPLMHGWDPAVHPVIVGDEGCVTVVAAGEDLGGALPAGGPLRRAAGRGPGAHPLSRALPRRRTRCGQDRRGLHPRGASGGVRAHRTRGPGGRLPAAAAGRRPPRGARRDRRADLLRHLVACPPPAHPPAGRGRPARGGQRAVAGRRRGHHRRRAHGPHACRPGHRGQARASSS